MPSTLLMEIDVFEVVPIVLCFILCSQHSRIYERNSDTGDYVWVRVPWEVPENPNIPESDLFAARIYLYSKFPSGPRVVRA